LSSPGCSGTTVSPQASTPAKGRTGRWRESQEERRQQQIAQNLNSILFRNTENLRKDVTKKRAFLEKELQADIQVLFI
jgi:hypothetical protein